MCWSTCVACVTRVRRCVHTSAVPTCLHICHSLLELWRGHALLSVLLLRGVSAVACVLGACASAAPVFMGEPGALAAGAGARAPVVCAAGGEATGAGAALAGDAGAALVGDPGAALVGDPGAALVGDAGAAPGPLAVAGAGTAAGAAAGAVEAPGAGDPTPAAGAVPVAGVAGFVAGLLAPGADPARGAPIRFETSYQACALEQALDANIFKLVLRLASLHRRSFLPGLP